MLLRLNLIAKTINHFYCRVKSKMIESVNDKFEKLEGIEVYSRPFTSRSNNYVMYDKEGYDQLAARSPYPTNEPFIYGIYGTIGYPFDIKVSYELNTGGNVQ